jgi:hypothetical protein
MARPLRGTKHDHAETLPGAVAFTERGAGQVKSLDFSRYVLSACVAAAMLAGCGGSQPPIGAPGAMPQASAIATHADRGKSWMLPEAKSDDLLYVSSFTSGRSQVSVYTYPGGRHVGYLGAQDAGGLCSDAAGDVFVVQLDREDIAEYAHGGTVPIATLDDSYNNPNGCAVDPTTGNLAVAGGDFFYGASANVALFPNAMGSPTVYYDSDDLTFSWCTYDDQGNLFANGRTFHHDESGIAELPVGGSTFSQITVENANVHGGGSLQWDGNYLAVTKIHGGAKKSEPAAIYQLQISGQNGSVVNTVELQGSHVSDRSGWITQQFWVHNHTVISPRNTGNRVGLWEYPAGGDPIRSNVRVNETALGLTVSVGPGSRHDVNP